MGAVFQLYESHPDSNKISSYACEQSQGLHWKVEMGVNFAHVNPFMNKSRLRVMIIYVMTRELSHELFMNGL